MQPGWKQTGIQKSVQIIGNTTDFFFVTDASGIAIEFVKCIILLVLKFPSHLFSGGNISKSAMMDYLIF